MVIEPKKTHPVNLTIDEIVEEINLITNLKYKQKNEHTDKTMSGSRNFWGFFNLKEASNDIDNFYPDTYEDRYKLLLEEYKNRKKNGELSSEIPYQYLQPTINFKPNR